jgi:alpha 1,6-mannosyltransferase
MIIDNMRYCSSFLGQRSDTLRYLLLLLNGGIYSDTDTSLLKAPSHWGSGATLWRNGAGWLADEDKARIDAGEDFNKVIGKASVVVGVEADVGGREDWFDWWPRPVCSYFRNGLH